MKKIKLNCAATMEETFSDFLTSRKAKGLADKTLQSYEQQFRAVARHLDVKTDIALLQKADLDAMIISMRDASLSPNSINSYTRTLKSFFSWCNEQGITRLNIPLYKAEETVKETYSDAELAALLKKPDIRKATFIFVGLLHFRGYTSVYQKTARTQIGACSPFCRLDC